MTAKEMWADGSILQRCADGEPVFVLRAQDKLAPAVVRVWAELAKTHGVDWKKIADAEQVADDMALWAEAFGSKVPD